MASKQEVHGAGGHLGFPKHMASKQEVDVAGGHIGCGKEQSRLHGSHLGTPNLSSSHLGGAEGLQKHSGGHLTTPELEGRHVGAPSLNVNTHSAKTNTLAGQAISVLKQSPFEGDKIDSDQLIQSIRLMEDLEAKRKQLGVEMKAAYNQYSYAKVEDQEYYLSKVNHLNAVMFSLDKELDSVRGQIGPMAEVYANRRRFEASAKILKEPVLYRSPRQVSSSESDREGRTPGKLHHKKTVVAQIHAPNFVFTQEELATVQGKVKKGNLPQREVETFVFSQDDFPSLPSYQESGAPQGQTEVSVVKQSASDASALGHGECSDMELTVTPCVDGPVAVSVGVADGKKEEPSVGVACMSDGESDGENAGVVTRCVESVLQEPQGRESGTAGASDVAVEAPSGAHQSVPLTVPVPGVSSAPNPLMPPPPSSIQANNASMGRNSGQKINPPQPPNAWNRPLNRVRVPGVERRVTGPVFKLRNRIRLKWEGERESMPSRDVIGKELLLKQATLTPADVRACIKNSELEYDIVFRTSNKLEYFWHEYDHFRSTGLWKNFKVIPVTKPETKKVTVLFKNDNVPPEDIAIWLGRHCKVLSPLTMDIDNNGYWSGGWCANVELRMRYNIPQHLPNSVFIGDERGVVFYPGQPRACFKCGSYGHRANACAVVRCSLCGDVGHIGRDCKDVKCNLCGFFGHSHRACPEALHNIRESCPNLEEEMAEEMLEEIREELRECQPPVQGSESHQSISQPILAVQPHNPSPPPHQPKGPKSAPLPQRQSSKPILLKSGSVAPKSSVPSKGKDWVEVGRGKGKQQAPQRLIPSMEIDLSNKFTPLSRHKSWGEEMEEHDELKRMEREEERQAEQERVPLEADPVHSPGQCLAEESDSGAEGDSESKSGDEGEMDTGQEHVTQKRPSERQGVKTQVKKGSGGGNLSVDTDEIVSIGDDDPVPSGVQVKRYGDLEGDTSQEDKRQEEARKRNKRYKHKS
ncbi:uncharacterized protein LOC116407952 [Xenopus tropicalis]|uniref:Uncharacterized protein LOC116407952 n=2 Tax=Xenopus tropicalis TaxID=8364 RepID=A0A8J1IX81_XENTR|nr:uncharacterized protein LOC116407952 [Xenopus tropicalis]